MAIKAERILYIRHVYTRNSRAAFATAKSVLIIGSSEIESDMYHVSDESKVVRGARLGIGLNLLCYPIGPGVDSKG